MNEDENKPQVEMVDATSVTVADLIQMARDNGAGVLRLGARGGHRYSIVVALGEGADVLDAIVDEMGHQLMNGPPSPEELAPTNTAEGGG